MNFLYVSSTVPSLFVCCITVLAVFIGGLLVSLLLPQKYVNLKKKYVVITGCDSGFGAMALETIARETEALVIALCLTDDGCKQALASGADSAIKCDFLDENAIAKVADEITQISGGRLWAIVHNAGCVEAGYLDFQPLANFRRTMEVNFFAIVNLNQRLMPCIKLTSGRVIIVSSIASMFVAPGNAPYCASKFACEAFAYSLRAESCFWGVKVCVINPSAMRTPMIDGFLDSKTAAWNAMDKINPTGLWKREWSQEWLDQHIALASKSLSTKLEDPMLVVKDMYDAVANVSPRNRYLSGMASKTMIRILWNCPESWTFALAKTMTSPEPTVLNH
jgi:NAD(P)-dependent dehydrogenase (short-subunit alcohol dehydrogenase family)